MQPWLRDPFAYPAGRAPGFDPTHVAAPGCVFSGVVLGQNGCPINLLKPTLPTKTGAPTGGITTTGPFTYSSAAGNGYTFSTPAINAGAAQLVITSAVIFTPVTVAGYQFLIGNTGATSAFYLDGGQLGYYIHGNNFNTSFVVSAGIPYFLASGFTGNGTFDVIATNLLTGQIFSSFGTVAGAAAYAYGNVTVGDDAAGDPSLGYLSAGYVSSNRMSAQQLLQWAADPWSFWYPNIDDALFSQSVGVTAVAAAPPLFESGGVIQFPFRYRAFGGSPT